MSSAEERVQEFVDAYRKMEHRDDRIYSVARPEGTFDLLASDLEELCRQSRQGLSFERGRTAFGVPIPDEGW